MEVQSGDFYLDNRWHRDSGIMYCPL